MKTPYLPLIWFFLISFLPRLTGEPAEVKFYYQTIDKKIMTALDSKGKLVVTQELPPQAPAEEPLGFFGKLFAPIKKTWRRFTGWTSEKKDNFIALHPTLCFCQKHLKPLPGKKVNSPDKEGEDIHDSHYDHERAWKVNRHLIKSPEHLLSLMGATSPGELNPTQQGLYNSYLFSKSTNFQNLNQASFEKKISVYLTDGKSYERDPHFKSDFWPHAYGNTITMGSAYFNLTDNPDETGRGLLAHEFSHTLDKTMAEPLAYGADGAHFVNEITTDKAAWVEGWAVYNQFKASPKVRESYGDINELKREGTEAGKYVTTPINESKPLDLLKTELIVARVLTDISEKIEGGEGKIIQTFQQTNHKDGTFSRFVLGFIKSNPQDAFQIMSLVDRHTERKMTQEEFFEFFKGNSQAQSYYYSTRSKSNPLPATDSIPSSLPDETSRSSGNFSSNQQIKPPYHSDDAKKLALNKFLKAKRDYQNGVTSGNVSDSELNTLKGDMDRLKRDYEQAMFR